jgi:outer membrane protein TolC
VAVFIMRVNIQPIARGGALLFNVGLILLVSSNSLAITKREAYDLMSRQGPKWKLTEALPQEAESKLNESRSKTRPQFAFGVTQYAARINPIQFGVDQPPVDLVGFGTTALEMRWHIVDPVANFERLTAEAQFDISKAQSRQYQTDLTAAMLVQYLTVQKLKSQLQTIEIASKRSAQILKLAQDKKRVGAGIEMDVTRARSLSELDRIKKLQLQTKLNKAANELALFLGQDTAQSNVEPMQFRPVDIAALRARLDEAPKTRADIATAHLGVLAARTLQEKASGRFFPKFSILGDLGTTRTTFIGLPPERATGFIGMRLEIPIESGGFIEAKRQGAAALGMKAEAQEAQTRLELQNQMKEVIEQLEAAHEAAQVAGAYVKSTEEEAAFVDRRFAGGSGSVVDVLNSYNTLATAKDTEIDAIFAYEAAQVALYRTIGSFDEYFK